MKSKLIPHRLKIKLRFEGFDLSILAIVLTLCLFGLLGVFWAGMSPDFSTPFVLVFHAHCSQNSYNKTYQPDLLLNACSRFGFLFDLLLMAKRFLWI